MIAMIGTSDRLCWLAETCKILLLLQLGDMPKAPAGLDDYTSGRLAKCKPLEMATACGLACKTSGTIAQ